MLQLVSIHVIHVKIISQLIVRAVMQDMLLQEINVIQIFPVIVIVAVLFVHDHISSEIQHVINVQARIQTVLDVMKQIPINAPNVPLVIM